MVTATTTPGENPENEEDDASDAAADNDEHAPMEQVADGSHLPPPKKVSKKKKKPARRPKAPKVVVPVAEEDQGPPEPIPPPNTDPLVLSALIMLRALHDEGEFELETGWPTIDAFEQVLEEPLLRPLLLGAILSRLTVSQSELRRMKSEGELDQRPMSEWVKDVFRVVSGWYASRERAIASIAEVDAWIEEFKNEQVVSFFS